MNQPHESILAVIPARGGSKGIKDKNICLLGGKPLITYTIAAASKSHLISRIVVSTDSPSIREVAISAGADVPFLRPNTLAGDSVHSVEAVIHTLEWLEKNDGYVPKIVVMLLPTSPLRIVEDVNSAINLFQTSDALAVISVSEFDKQVEHFRFMNDEKVLEPVVKKPDIAGSYNVQRQDLKPLYLLNGSIYVSKPSTLREKKTFHVPNAIGYVMPTKRSIDINNWVDIEYAEFLLNKGVL